MIWLISYSHFYIFLVHSAMVADRYIENSIGQPYQLESWPLCKPKVGPNKFETSFCCYYRVSKGRLAVMECNCNYSSLAVMTRNWGSTRPKSYLIPTFVEIDRIIRSKAFSRLVLVYLVLKRQDMKKVKILDLKFNCTMITLIH